MSLFLRTLVLCGILSYPANQYPQEFAMSKTAITSPEIMRQYLAAHAPELEVVELPEAHTTEYISREWKVLPAQVAKTLTLRVGDDAIIVVTCGDARLDNRKVKEELGGKGHMMPGSEASEITGHPVGAITPLCLGSLLPVCFDIGLKRFEEVVTAGGSTHAAIRIPLTRFASSPAPRGSTSAKRCKPMERAPTAVQLHM